MATESKLKAAEALFITAHAFNWDSGVRGLRRLLENPGCDRATALLIYWLGRPGFYNDSANDSLVPSFAKQQLTLIRSIEKRIEQYPSVLAFDPRKSKLLGPDLVPRNRGRIPAAMYRACKGRVRADDVVGRTEAADQLIRACREGQMRDVAAYCRRGLDVNEPDSNGELALHTAIRAGNVALTTYLLARGADATATTNNGATALHEAFYASRPCFELLLDKGVDIDVEGDDGSVLRGLVLWWSASGGSLPAKKKNLTYLLSRGADPRGALAVAKSNRLKDVVQILTAAIEQRSLTSRR